MPFEQLLALAVIQGLTEFLPISSSGHLNLLHLLTAWEDEGAYMDVAIHVGSLLAVMLYFWRDMLGFLAALARLVRGEVTAEGRLLLLIIAASVPIFAAGYVVMKSGLMPSLRTLPVIAWANMVFAVVLYAADRLGRNDRRCEELTLGDAILVGLSQVLSIVPGASRAGVTMSMARFLGMERTEAARFSMFLSIPTIIGLGAAAAYELRSTGDLALQQNAVVAAGLSFVAALASIAFMMALLRRWSMTPFVVYRVVLGAVLLGYVYLA